MAARLNAMEADLRGVKDRIYELLCEWKTPFEITDELGLDEQEGPLLVWRVIDERGMPSDESIRRNLEQLAAIRF
jgi:hypothetical protein